MTENDILILLIDYVQRKRTKNGDFVINFADADRELNLPEGSTAKHVEVAAAEVDCEVVRRGDTLASLRWSWLHIA